MDRQLVTSIDTLDNLSREAQYGIALFGVVNSKNVNDFRLISLNSAFQQILGERTPHSQFLSKISSFSNKKELLDALRKAYLEQRSCRLEITSSLPNTELRWYDLTIIPIQDHLLVTSKEITELKQQRELARQAVFLQHAFSACLDGVLIFNIIRNIKSEVADFQCYMTNEASLLLLGLKREEAVGKTLNELHSRMGLFGLSETFKQVYQTGQSYSEEFVYPTNSNWYQAAVIRIADGIIVTYHDITHHKQAQQFDIQTDVFKQSIFAHIRSALALLEPILDSYQQITDYRVLQGNPQLASILNKEMDQLTGLILSSSASTDLISKTFLYGQQVIEDNKAQEFQASCSVNGESHTFDCILFKVSHQLLLVCTDVTLAVSSQREVVSLSREVRLSAQHLQEFLYIASHDLQEPLRKIQAFGDLLNGQYAQLSGEGADYLKRMQKSAQRMNDLIAALLKYSRLSTQLQSFSLVSLSDVLTIATQTLDEEIIATSAILDIQKLPSVRGDFSQLVQLFENLLSNGLKFVHSQQQPHILISWVKLQDEEDLLKMDTPIYSRATSFLRIDVTDRGIGFDEKYAGRIFGIFQRLHTKERYPGVGIGLAICQRVVKNHSGFIRVHSKPNQGTTFEIYLPT